jgi:hypothetical protein
VSTGASLDGTHALSTAGLWATDLETTCPDRPIGVGSMALDTTPYLIRASGIDLLMGGRSRDLDSTLRYDFADVQNCLKNAHRLRKDSHFCTRSTKAALLELALEEVGKGSLLCLRLFAHRKEDDPSPILSGEGEALKKALVGIATPHEAASIRDAFDISTFVKNAKLDELFESHPAKLAGIVRLSKIVRVTHKIVVTHPLQFVQAMEAAPELVRSIRSLGRIPEYKFERLKEVNHPEYLLDLRERGLYVGIDPRRASTVLPQVASDEVKKLIHALDAAAALVDGWILVYHQVLKA